MPRHDEDLDDDFDDDDLDDDPVAAEAERQQLIADYARLGRDVEDLQKRMDERYRGKTRWDRLALVGLALLSVGALMYVLTGSWLWTTLGVVLGVPALVIGAVVVLASVSEMRQRARAGRTKTLGEIRLVHDLEGQRVAMTHDLGAAQALVIYPALLDFAVTRWGVQYAPDDHGARLASRVARLASSALEQLEDGALPGDLVLDEPEWEVVDPDLLAGLSDRLDLVLTIGELDGARYVTSHSEPMMGHVDKGEVATAACFALLTNAIREGRAHGKGLAAGLLVQVDAFAARGSRTPRGRSVAALAAR